MQHFVTVRAYLRIRVTLVMLCGLLLSPHLQADYLSDLETEAKSLDNPSSAAPASDGGSGWSVKDLEISNSMQPGLDQALFEQHLKNSFIGSYSVYSRLTGAQKALVYASYKDGVSIDEIKLLIRDLYNEL